MNSLIDNVNILGDDFKTIGNSSTSNEIVMSAKNCNVFYGDNQALKNFTLDVGKSEVLALIGPSGCGKSTFIRCLNRLNDTIQDCRISGNITLEGKDIYSSDMDVVLLRARVGMVFQKPNPFPKSIYENVAYGPRIHGMTSTKNELDDLVETSLDKAGLLEEVKDRLNETGTSLSGGQQQRLCIARAIAVQPDIILMDEPGSALDPIATEKIENLINELKKNYAIVMVTHSMSQAARISQRAAYFHLGHLVEIDSTTKIFNQPEHTLTQNYISGRMG